VATGGAYSARPDPISGLRGPTFKGRKGREGRGWKKREGRPGKRRKRRGEERSFVHRRF